MDTMTRDAKGRVAPPPKLGPAAQQVADAVARMAGVTAQAHWEIGSQTDVNGTDFYVGQSELGHIHLDGEAHIPIGGAVAALLIRKKLARRFRWSGDFVVVDTAAPETALKIFGLRHAQIAGASEAEIIAAI